MKIAIWTIVLLYIAFFIEVLFDLHHKEPVRSQQYTWEYFECV